MMNARIATTISPSTRPRSPKPRRGPNPHPYRRTRQPTRLGPSRTPYRIRRIAAGIQTLADMNLPKEFPGRRMSGALRAIGRRSPMASGASPRPTGTTGASPRSDTGTVGPNPSPTGDRTLAST